MVFRLCPVLLLVLLSLAALRSAVAGPWITATSSAPVDYGDELEFRTDYRWDSYHNYTSLEETLRRLSSDFPQSCRLYSIGRSVQGRELWVVELSSRGLGEIDDGRPHVNYIANSHGNEAVGRELLMRLAHHLLETSANSSSDDHQVAETLLSAAHVHILPSLNPDGFESAAEADCGVDGTGHDNANGVDLEHNFPDRFARNVQPVQPETQAVVNWTASVRFSLSASFHGRQLVASYPFYGTDSGQRGYAVAADDATLRWLAGAYAAAHPSMRLGGRACAPRDNSSFLSGTTNGAAWWPRDGTLSDFQYARGGGMAVAVQLGCCAFPPASALAQLWSDNRPPLLTCLSAVLQGVRGRLVSADAGRGPLAGASVAMENENGTHVTVPTASGHFWRVLAVGERRLTFSAAFHSAVSRSFAVTPGQCRDLGVVTLPVAASTVTAPSISPAVTRTSVPVTSLSAPTTRVPATSLSPPATWSSTGGSLSSPSPTVAPVPPLPPRRLLSAGGIAGILVAVAVLVGVVVVVMMNLRRFVIKRRAYSKLGGSSHYNARSVRSTMPKELLGRLY